MGTRGRSARWILASLPLASCYSPELTEKLTAAADSHATQSTGEASDSEASATSPISTVTSNSSGSGGGEGGGSDSETDAATDLPPVIKLFTANGSSDECQLLSASKLRFEAFVEDDHGVEGVTFTFRGVEYVGEQAGDSAPYVAELLIDSADWNSPKEQVVTAVARDLMHESSAELPVKIALPQGGVGVWEWFDTKIPGVYYDVAVDSAGFTTAVGYQFAKKEDPKRWHATIRNYTPDGALNWERLYPDPVLDGASEGVNVAFGVAVDSEGNVVVVGDSTVGEQSRPFTLRFTPDGSRFDARLRGLGEHARDVAVGLDDSIAIAGYVELPGDVAYAMLWTYNGDGSPRTSTSYKVQAMTRTIAQALVIDPKNDQRIYVVGHASTKEVEARGFLLEVDGGAVTWTRSEIGEPKEAAYGVAFSAEEDLVVIGRRAAKQGLVSLRKFDAFSGDELKGAVYFDTDARCSVEGCGLAIDGSDNLLVSGASYNPQTKNDVLVKKYGSGDLKTKWVRFSDMQSGEDLSYAVAVDSVGFIYAAGGVSYNGARYAWVSELNP